MPEDAAGIRRVVLVCGKGTLFLFCGQRTDRTKGLLWTYNHKGWRKI